jgi:hypothetical protein
MVRTLVVKQATNLRSVGSTLLDARFGGTQSDAAIERLKELNPHVDPEKIPAGTVLLVPDAPAFKASASSSTQVVPLDDFGALVTGALDDLAEGLKNDAATRAAERSDLASVLKGPALKRVIGDDKDLAQQVADAQKAITAEEKDDKQAQETLVSMSKAALAALSQVGKLIG